MGVWKYLVALVAFGVAGATSTFWVSTDRELGTHGWQYAAPWDTQLYDALYQRADVPKLDDHIYGAIVPHHLLAGHLVAELAETLKKQKPSVIVLIGPNHFGRGSGDMITTRQDWQTIYGEYETDIELVDTLVAQGLLRVEEDVIKEEHAIYGLVPFFKRSLPGSSILPIALSHNLSAERRDALVSALIETLPKDAVVIASIDFSHYQTDPVADFHDDYTRAVIQSFDYERFDQLEIDSVPSLDVVMHYLEAKHAQTIISDHHTNAAKLAGNRYATNITSYYAPMFGKGNVEQVPIVSLLHGGDVMLGRDVDTNIRERGQEYVFDTLAGEEGRFLYGFDAFGVNLEGPFVYTKGASTKPAHFTFGFDPAFTDILTEANISVVSQANNHSYDYGKRGQGESREILDHAGITWYGAQYDVSSSSLIYKTFGKKTVAFIGVNDTNGGVDESRTLALIAEAELRADYTVMNVHWGIEYEPVSHARQQYLAHTFVDGGVDVIIGHHPHVVQEIEVYNNRPIFYSLGNLVFDQYWSTATQQGLLVGTVFYDDMIRVYLFPTESHQAAVRLMEPKQAEQFVRDILKKSRLENITINNQSFDIPW